MAAEDPLQDPRRDPLRQKLSDRFADFEADPRPDLRAAILASAARPAATAGQWRVLGFLLGLLLISVQLNAPMSPQRTPVRSSNLPPSRVIQQGNGAAGSAPSLARHRTQLPAPILTDQHPIELLVDDQMKRPTPEAAGYVAASKQVSTSVAVQLVAGRDQRFPARDRPLSKRIPLPSTNQPTRQEIGTDSVMTRLVTPQATLNADSESIPVDPASPTRSVFGEVQPISIRLLSGLPGTRLQPFALVPPVQIHPVQQSLSSQIKRWQISVGVAPLLTYQEVIIPNTADQVLLRQNQAGALSGERFGYQAFVQTEKQLCPRLAIAGSILYTHLQLAGKYAQWNGRYQVDYIQGSVPTAAPELLAIATDNRFDALAFRAELVYSFQTKKSFSIRSGAEYQYGLSRPGHIPFVVIGAGSYYRVLGHRVAVEPTFRYALRPQAGLTDNALVQIRPYSFGLTIRVPLN